MYKNKLMRILFLNGDIIHGGVERQILYTAEAFQQKQDVKLFLVYYQERSDTGTYTLPIDIQYIPWPASGKKGLLKFLFFPLFLFKLMCFCLRHKIDILHGYGPLDNVAVVISGTLLGKKKITSIRTSCEWALRGHRLWVPFSDRIISNSLAAFRLLTVKTRVQQSKLTLVRNGIKPELFPFKNRDFSVRKKIFTFSIIGRMSPSKNQLLFISSFADFLKQKKLSPSAFHIIFCGPVERKSYFTTIKNLLKKTGLDTIAEIKPYTDDIMSVYNKTDFLVLPSRSEGLPNVLLEAMAAGLPWIASDIADIKYLSGENSERGLTFCDNDRHSLCKALKTFFALKPEELKQKVRDARLFVERNFKLQDMSEKIHQLYRSLLL
jgi:glycosyltransferase involved in cell wall biosynthesis